MACNRGPAESPFTAVLWLPASLVRGQTVDIRVDSVASGRLEHFGLNDIRDMRTEYALGHGVHYVEGSARIVPGSGTANARAGAKVWHEHGRIIALLPARIVNGDSYTPPSVEFAVQIDAPDGRQSVLGLWRYEVTANAFLIGDVRTHCVPTPKPFPLAAIQVESPPR